MSAASLNPAAAAPAAPIERSEGVWHAAWRRFKADRVGLVSALIVLAFLGLVLLASLGLVAKNWQAEVGVANAPPTFIGPKPPEATGTIEVPKGPNVDLSAVDPLAPRYAEIEEAAKKYRTTETAKAETLPLGGDRLGRDVLDKAVKGTQISVFVGVLAAVLAVDAGTAQRLVQARQRQAFERLEQVRALLPPGSSVDAARVSVGSEYFEVRGRLRLQDRVLEEISLVRRRGATEVQAVHRLRRNLQAGAG